MATARLSSTVRTRDSYTVLDGAIRPGEIYSVAESKRRLNCSEWAWREFKARLGGRLFKVGVAKFCKSDDLIDVLEEIAREQGADR